MYTYIYIYIHIYRLFKAAFLDNTLLYSFMRQIGLKYR